MSSASGLRIVVAIMLMGVCGWLIYGAIVGGASAEERYLQRPQRPITVATEPASGFFAKIDAPKARPGRPGPRDAPPKHVPPKGHRAASLLA